MNCVVGKQFCIGVKCPVLSFSCDCVRVTLPWQIHADTLRGKGGMPGTHSQMVYVCACTHTLSEINS